MTGHSGVQYDNDRQTAAATKVVETWDAVDGSRNGANALSAAQQSSFWGQETGPVQMRTRATDMFDAISELLTAERDLIQEFEAYMHRAMKEFTGVEYANATEDHVGHSRWLHRKELCIGNHAGNLRAYGNEGIDCGHRQGIPG